MNVADLIHLLKSMDPKAIVVVHDHLVNAQPAVSKLGVGEVNAVQLQSTEDFGLVWLRLAEPDMPGNVPGVLLGDSL